MATQLQLRRGTTAENDAFIGAIGELTMDTTTNTVRIHDGETQGGYKLMGFIDYSTVQTADLSLGSFTAPYDCLVIYQSGLKNAAQEALYIGTTRVLLAENSDNNWTRSTTVFPMSAGEILTGLAANDANRDSQLQYFKFKGA